MKERLLELLRNYGGSDVVVTDDLLNLVGNCFDLASIKYDHINNFDLRSLLEHSELAGFQFKAQSKISDEPETYAIDLVENGFPTGRTFLYESVLEYEQDVILLKACLQQM